MRYRLLASYQGAPYEAGIGPGDVGVVLFAACPPPEDLHFEPATGHWRKTVRRGEVQSLYESRPVGLFRGEACVVLDDLNDRLHIAYLGHDALKAEQLGYWEVDRGVFELIAPRPEVTEIVEQRLPISGRDDGDRGDGPRGGDDRQAEPPYPAPGQGPGQPGQAGYGASRSGYGSQSANGRRPSLLPPDPGSSPRPDLPGFGHGGSSGAGLLDQPGSVSIPAAEAPPLPLEAQAMRAATAAARRDKDSHQEWDADGGDPAHDAPAQDDAGRAGTAGAAAGQGLPPHGQPGQTSFDQAPYDRSQPGTGPVIPRSLAGLSEPSTAARPPGGGASAVPSWTPPPPVPPQRPAQPETGLTKSGPADADAGTPSAGPAPAPPTAEPLPAQQPAAQQPAAQQPAAQQLTANAPVQATAAEPPAAQPPPEPSAPNDQRMTPPTDRREPGPALPGLGYGVHPGAAGYAEPGGTAARNGTYGRPSAQALADAAPLDPYRHDLADPSAEPPAVAGQTAPPSAMPPAAARRAPVPSAMMPPAIADPAPGQAMAPAEASEPDRPGATAAAPGEHDESRASRRRRSARRRLPTQRIFSELAGQAGIPARAYAIGEDVEGAMCLLQTEGGFEVFNSLGGARHEVRAFADEESAYFYLFGVLAAEAVRTGTLGVLGQRS